MMNQIELRDKFIQDGLSWNEADKTAEFLIYLERVSRTDAYAIIEILRRSI